MNHAAEFCCHLDGQPDHLTPEHQLGNYWTENLVGHPLFLNKSCQFTHAGAVPRELANNARLADGFASFDDMAWVRNSATGALQPFWIGSQVQSLLTNIHNGEPASSLPDHYKRSLVMAGVLTAHDHKTLQSQRATSMLSRCSEQVRQQGYAPVAGLIHPFHISALRRYYRNLMRTGKLALGDSQSSRRYHAHNESVARFFHFQLTAAVSGMVGERVKPSYVYFASYQEGASLGKHTDRKQCEFSITLCLDYSPEPQRQTPWPLQLHTPKGVTTVYQSIGDALVYRGCELPHSRGVLPFGHTSTSIFFHYVPENFNGPLD